MTGGPSAGPASAYETFRTPASICFSGPNDVWAPGLSAGNFVLAGCAFAKPVKPNWAAAAVIAAAPMKLRRRRSIFSDILTVFIWKPPRSMSHLKNWGARVGALFGADRVME